MTDTLSSSAPVATDAEPVTLLSDGDQLHAAVLRSPDDDAPRLAYADWLRERGQDERAEFIRVQIEIGRLRGLRSKLHGPEGVERLRRLDASHPDRKEDAALCEAVANLMPRERELFRDERFDLWAEMRGVDVAMRPGTPTVTANAHLPRWRLRYGHSRRPDPEVWFILCRGFVGAMEMEAADWIAHADALIRRHPVREVTLTTWPSLDERAELYRRNRANGNEIPDWPDSPGHVLDSLLPMVWPSVKTWSLPPASPEPALDYRGVLEGMRRAIERGIVGRYSDHLRLMPESPPVVSEWGRSDSTPLGDIRALRNRFGIPAPADDLSPEAIDRLAADIRSMPPPDRIEDTREHRIVAGNMAVAHVARSLGWAEGRVLRASMTNARVRYIVTYVAAWLMGRHEPDRLELPPPGSLPDFSLAPSRPPAV